MARRGTFGRAPRTAPNLTNTLISIAREMQNRRDQNIMDAWKGGGEFEGKPVTDEMVLAHWKGRLEGLSKDDPMYDTYKTAFTQYTYAIEESKQSTLYAQGKIGDAAMAGFYLKWAKHPDIPHNSEFYRVLQRDGAQFIRAASAKGKAEAARRKEQAYQDNLAGLHKKNEAGGEFMTEVLTIMAQVGSADHAITGLIGAPGSNSDLTQFDSSDPEQMLRMLSFITPTTPAGPDERQPAVGSSAVLYHDPITGLPVTGADIVKKMKTLDPSYKGGMLDLATVRASIKSQLNGIQARIDLANSTGHISDANSFKKQQEYVATLGRQVNAWPVEQDYMHLRSAYQQVINDTSALPGAKVDAWNKYQTGLMNLSEDPRIAADDRFRSSLVGEAQGSAGTVTMAESFTQAANTQPDPNSDVAQNKLHIEALQADMDLLKNDPLNYAYTTGTYDGQGLFTAKVGGPALGVASVESIKAFGGSPQHIFAPTSGGAPTPILVVDMPVTAVARNPDGSNVNLDNTNPVASVYQVSIGGTTMKVYGFDTKDAQGNVTRMYSAEPPWDENKVRTSTSKGGGIVLDMTNAIAPGAGGFTLKGGHGATRGAKGKAAELYMDPKTAALSSDPTRFQAGGGAGYDPFTDFYSPTLAALMSTPEGHKTLSGLQKDPLFMEQMQYEAYTAAGGKVPMSDSTWKTGVGADPMKYGKYQNQNVLAGNVSAEGVTKWFQSLWTSNDKTGTMYPLDNAARLNGDPKQQYGLKGDTLLPMDALKGSPMAALGTGTIDGTNQLWKGKQQDDQLAIKLQGSLKLPSYSSPVPTPAPAMTPGSPMATIKPFVAPTPPPPAPPGPSSSSGNRWQYERNL